jgi:hypothetical protein
MREQYDDPRAPWNEPDEVEIAQECWFQEFEHNGHEYKVLIVEYVGLGMEFSKWPNKVAKDDRKKHIEGITWGLERFNGYAYT